jgi:hypothetical protein
MGKRSLPLGILALLFFILHEAVYIHRGHPANGLWSCNVGLLAIAIGLLIPSAITNAVGTFWLTAGLPLWLYYLATTGDIIPTTLLSHLGGLLFGYAGIKRLGLPGVTWFISVLALFPLILLSRPLSLPDENINFSYGIYSGAETIFSTYWVFILAIGIAFIAVFRTLQWALPKLGFAKS